MNIFNIPSWYPSDNNPIYGTFVKEQIEMLARHNPDWKLAVSTWGQGNPDHMLWVKDHVKNVSKLLKSRESISTRQQNIYQYYSPTPTWTRKIKAGNLQELIKVNSVHFDSFQGKVEKVDIIHAQATYPAALIAEELSGKFNVPYVVTIRMSPFPFDEFLDNGDLKPWIRKPLQNAKALIATSNSLKNRLGEFGFQNVSVIHNPVDTDFFKPKEHPPLPSSKGDQSPTILTIGRMVPQKGIDILIRAIAELGHEFEGKFRIGGDGEKLSEYQALAQSLNVSNKITWLGELSREQVRDEMQHCSFYVLPSRHETFGNVLLEAMACGKPVVATKCGGPEDIVNSDLGLLVEPENVQSLRDGLKKMNSSALSYSDKRILEQLENKFSIIAFTSKFLELAKGTK